MARFLPLNSTQLKSTQLNSTQLNSTQLNSTQLNSTQLNSTQLNSTIMPFLQKLIPPCLCVSARRQAVPPLKTCPRMLLSGKGPACAVRQHADRDSGGFACFAIELFINALFWN